MIRNFLGVSLALVLFSLIPLAIWLWAFIDCFISNKRTEDKLVWLLIILFFNVIGAIVYLLFGRKETLVKSSKKLYRSRKNRVIAGVCGGLGSYFGIDPTIIRLIWVLLILVGGTGLFAYLIAWIVIPEK